MYLYSLFFLKSDFLSPRYALHSDAMLTTIKHFQMPIVRLQSCYYPKQGVPHFANTKVNWKFPQSSNFYLFFIYILYTLTELLTGMLPLSLSFTVCVRNKDVV